VLRLRLLLLLLLLVRHALLRLLVPQSHHAPRQL
jgi:hypothetical protein